MTPASAFASQTSDAGSSDPPRQEPSMEDILASIRRIIADDQSQGTRASASARRPAPAASRPERAADHGGEVLDLGGRVPAAGVPDRGSPARSEAAPQPRTIPEPSHHPEDAPKPVDQGRTVRSAPAGAAPGHVNGYAAPTLVRDHDYGPYASAQPAPTGPDRYQAMAGQGTAEHSLEETGDDDGLMSPVLGTSVMSAFETLAATVVLQNSDLLTRVMRELMRPLIKTWLDENLPGLVEKLVRGEIERMARGGRN